MAINYYYWKETLKKKEIKTKKLKSAVKERKTTWLVVFFILPIILKYYNNYVQIPVYCFGCMCHKYSSFKSSLNKEMNKSLFKWTDCFKFITVGMNYLLQFNWPENKV